VHIGSDLFKNARKRQAKQDRVFKIELSLSLTFLFGQALTRFQHETLCPWYREVKKTNNQTNYKVKSGIWILKHQLFKRLIKTKASHTSADLYGKSVDIFTRYLQLFTF